MKTAYKFLRTGLKSDYDGSQWEVGVWRHVDPPVEECKGLNASKLIPDALNYVQGEILARVEYQGTVIDSTDKVTCESMRIVETWAWSKEMSVKMAIYAARLVLPIWERRYPDDDRTRKSIEAAEAWLNDPSTTAAAWDAAWAAAWAAAVAWDAARDAAWAAAVACAAARAAAADVKQKIHRYILSELRRK